MAHIHFVESHTAHASDFVIDVPIGYHWLLVITKTPAQFWVDGQIKEYPAHSAVLYRPLQKVYYRACSDQFINDWIRFESSEPYITESSLPFGEPFSLEDPDYCHKLIQLLVIEHHFDRDYKTSSIDCLLRTLFNKLLESCFREDISPHYYNLLRVRTAIHSNPGDTWSVTKMAEHIRVSPGYFQTIYKKAFGISCMEDVINSRVRLAKEYLIHSSRSVAEIASQCGYQNVEHFCRQFKQVTGSTPRNFQRDAK